jgi:16S rRNA (guanine527-N7)-methyltransferase
MAQTLYGTDVSRETLKDLSTYHDLLLRWTKSINLIARSTVVDAWDRHIADSAQLFALIPARAQTLIDIGSGGGLPGLVLAIMAKEQMPQLRLMLVESDQRKATFLRTVVRELRLPADVRAERIEDVVDIRADVITARALASLPQLLEFAAGLMHPAGVALFHKGRGYEVELIAAQTDWQFSVQAHISQTDPDARLLQIEEIHRASH